MKHTFRLPAAGLAILCLLLLLPVPARGASMDIRIGIKCKCPPYQFLDQEGNPTGLHIEIMDIIAKKQHFSVTYVVYETSADAEQALRDHEIDAVLGVLSDQPRPSDMSVTESISSGTIAMISDQTAAQRILEEPSGVYRFDLAFELGTVSFSQINQLHSKHTIVAGDQLQLFDHLANQEVDAVVGIKESILYQSQHSSLPRDGLTLVNSNMSRIQYAILVRRGDLMLLNRLQQGIAQLRNSDEYDHITKRWITDEKLEQAQHKIVQLLIAIALTVTLSGALVLVFNFWNRRLQRAVRDQTEEIRLQFSRLEEAGTLQKLLIQNFPNSILILRPDGAVLLMNPQAEHVAQCGHTDWSDPDRPLRNISDLRLFRKIWAATSGERGGMISSAILPIALSAGREKQFRYQYYRLNQQGNCVLLVEDVTKEEEQRHELYEANKNQLLNHLIAGIAHEIKNPLTSIQAFASVMREQGSDPEFQESFARYVPQEVERINRLVESLIHYAKPSKGIKERVDVRQLIQECVYPIRASVKNKRFTFQCSCDIQASILIDQDKAKQALLNLLLNSMEAVGERLEHQPGVQPVISVSAACQDGWVHICVRDEGVGMDEEGIRNCTEPFYTTKAKGTGLGLSLVKQFVTENGGRFRIASQPCQYTEISMLFKEDVQP